MDEEWEVIHIAFESRIFHPRTGNILSGVQFSFLLLLLTEGFADLYDPQHWIGRNSMASPVGHALIGLSAYTIGVRCRFWTPGRATLLAITAVSLLPDLDFLPVLFIGFDKANQLHHVYTHTLGFCLLGGVLGGMAAQYTGRFSFKIGFLASFSLLTLHLLADTLCFDNRPPYGAMIFWPLSERYLVSPVSVFMGVAKQDWRTLFGWYNVISITWEMIILMPFLYFLYRDTTAIPANKAIKV